MFGKYWKVVDFEFHRDPISMATQNQGSLMDYKHLGNWCLVWGISRRWKGLGLVFSGFFLFLRHFENNVTALISLDSKTNV